MFGERTKLKESGKDALRGFLGMNYIAVIILILLVVFRTCQSIHRPGRKMVAEHFTTIPCKPFTANRHKAIFYGKIRPCFPFCMLALKFLELFCAFL